MAKAKNQATPIEDIPADRSEPQTYGPGEGGNNILAAWRGLVNLFNAQVERFDVTPDGIVAVGFTSQSSHVDRDTLVDALIHHGEKTVSRNLDLVSLYPYVQDPTNVEPFTKSNDMTQWMVANTKGSGEGDGSRSPQWAKDTIASYKSERNIAAPRGRKRRTIRLDNLGEVRPETLDGVALVELQALQATIAEAVAAAQANA